MSPTLTSPQVLMEYSGGQNLEMYVTRRSLPLAALPVCARELLEGLQYLHNKDVTHKNLRVGGSVVAVLISLLASLFLD